MVRDLDLDLDLGSGQGHVNVHSTCSTICMLNHVNIALRTTEIWPFEFREISNSRDSFPRRKFKNRAPTSCSPGPMLSTSAISFELQGGGDRRRKVQSSQLRKLRDLDLDLDLDLRSGQGRTDEYMWSRSTRTPN